jgi:arabinose-5-phosphate isomerase
MNDSPPKSDQILAVGRSVIAEESAALRQLAESLGESFASAVRLILDAPGQTIITGIGKSGIIGQKIAATLASTGTPSKFLHPVEGLHGDLGIVQPGDVLIALSKSGHTEELVRFVGHYKRIGGGVIAVCESQASPLAELSELVLLIPACPEAGPLQLAPTTSSTVMLALGDALAMALLDARGFKAEQFARFHPEGSLGKRLLLRAADVMHHGDRLPRVASTATFNDMLLAITGGHIGMTCIVEDDGTLLGVFTDGDLRRLLQREAQPGALDARTAWRRSRRDPDDVPVAHSTIEPDALAVECLRIMRESAITSLVIARSDRVPLGIVRLQDLLQAGLS